MDYAEELAKGGGLMSGIRAGHGRVILGRRQEVSCE